LAELGDQGVGLLHHRLGHVSVQIERGDQRHARSDQRTHRGEEIAAAVIDGPHSVVWHQAARRLTAMRGILSWLVSKTQSERVEP